MSLIEGVSKYVAVREHLLGRIRDLEIGARLPAEPVLCEEYGVSRVTLRHAVDGLISEGWLSRQHGRGTFVSSPNYRTQYREEFAGLALGFHAQQTAEGNAVTTSVLSQSVRLATGPIAARLQIDVADPVIEMIRLRYVNAMLHHLVTTYLPHARFPGLADVDLTNDSLFSILRSQYGQSLFSNDLVVSIDLAEPDVARALDVPLYDKLLKVASTVSDRSGQVVAHGWSHFAPLHSEIAFTQHV